QALSFDDPNPESLSHAMARYEAMFDVIRDGPVAPLHSEIPSDLLERNRHLKGAGYYFDASQVAVCRLNADNFLAQPIRNSDVPALAAELEQGQPKTFAAGIEQVFADVLDSARTQHGPINDHTHAIVIAVEYWRDPKPEEPGCDWIHGTQAQRAAMLAAQTAVLLSSYLRMLGHASRSHTQTCSDVDLNHLAVASGIAAVSADTANNGKNILANPYFGERFGLAAVTTTLEIATDQPLAPQGPLDRIKSHGPSWWFARGTRKGKINQDPYKSREYRQGAYPFEKLKRQDKPTTFIDEDRVPRFPKRADFFARVICGDLGKNVQEQGKGGFYVMKSPIGACARRALGALLLLQFGEARGPVSASVADPKRNADNLRATSYYLSCDAVGLCRIPQWAYYSHDAGGNEMAAYHENGVNMLLDQGHETMEGCSGDDWISVAQSMRAYLRFSMLGGVVGEQIRRLGYSARVHTVLDGDVLQPPLLLLSGLGEVSRIGEVILHPYLGPRLKSGTVSTSMPMTVDKPINFGLQNFCESCNKCARECPSGAITAGPKLMYNGYEIWKSDAEKCARYRITNTGGGMCGRCMKTCPWNLEGLFADSAFRWAAMNLPGRARWLAELDDKLGRGSINPLKKWWWDIELDPVAGKYITARQTHARGLNTDLNLKYEDQTLAVYPADKMPPPYPTVFPVNREEGIERYKAMITPAEYKRRLQAGDTDDLVRPFKMPEGEPPVFPVVLKRREEMTADIARYEFTLADGDDLPAFDAGAHINVVIAPEYQRDYSLAGDPADKSRYVLGVLRESQGRGGSQLMHRAFREGKRVFISKPVNHFPLHENASHTQFFAGGIGVTPLLTMAHRLHSIGKDFDFHYSASSRSTAGFVDEIKAFPWAGKVQFHFKDEGHRANLSELIRPYRNGMHLYTCGAARYMDGVFEAGAQHAWPEDAMHREYFTVPEPPEYENFDFTLKLARSGKSFAIPADKSATDVLIDAGIHVDMKCSDGICGVCAMKYDPSESDEIEHRDYVLSKKQRAEQVILCSSRCAKPGGIVVIDL
ncbi:MAG: 4Fe-4S double cluster binding domain-containing protein, partial [Burkholderiaceae bacterium]